MTANFIQVSKRGLLQSSPTCRWHSAGAPGDVEVVS